MDKKTKNKLIIGGTFFGALAIYFATKPTAAQAEQTGSNNPVTPSVPSKPSPVYYPSGFPIVYGKYNANAKRLQAAMTGIVADGIIGAQTLSRWKQFDPTVTSSFIIKNETELQNAIAYINSKYTQQPTFPTYSPSIFTNSGIFVSNLQTGNSGKDDVYAALSGVKRSLL